MNNIIFYRTGNGNYSAGGSSQSLMLLGEFFSYDVGAWGDSVKKDLIDKELEGYSGQMCHADKQDDLVIISHQYIENLPDFVIPTSNLINLIDQWMEIIKDNPDEIVLIEEDGKYQLKPGPYTLVIHGEK